MVKDYFIIGAGISGLTLGYELAKNKKSVKIVESTNSVGGLAKSISFKDYVLDYGPHLYHSAHPEIIEYWRSFVGDDLVSKDFYSGNYSDGKIYDYPVNKETAKEQYLPKEYEIIKKQLAEVDTKNLSNASNYNEYVRSLAGDFLADKFFTKYPSKLWGIDTKNLSARFAPRRIEIRDKRLPFHSGPGRFAGIIEGGSGVLSKKIQEEIINNGGEIIFNSKISSIETDNQKNIVSLQDTDNKTYDVSKSCIISTIPVNALCKLLGYDTKLYFRKILLTNIIIKGKDPFPKDYDWLYFDQNDIPFHRVGVQTRFSRKNIKDGIHVLCCEIAFDENQDINIQEIESQCIESLVKLKLLDKSSVVDLHSFDVGPVYPGYYLGHELELNRVNGKLGAHKNLYQTGSLADYAYSDQQVLTAKSIDLAKELSTLSADLRSEIVKTMPTVKPSQEFIFGRSVISTDETKPPFTIAEIGLCHNGDVELCKKLILESKQSGFSAAKIQSYLPGRISKKSRTARYFEETLGQEESISDFIDKIIFNKKELKEIFEYANSIEYDLFSTPFDFKSADILNSFNVPGFKISSMDLVNIPLIKKVASFMKPVILSTGMATIGEIEDAINAVLATGNKDIAVLHCVSSYPCPIEDSNLRRIKMIQDTFKVIPGFSDHTVETITPAFSVSMGSRIIEKHVTLDKGLDGPDHNFSLTPNEMKETISLINNVQHAINGIGFSSSDVELIAKSNLRRSIYANGDLKRGDVMTMENIAIKSPGDGIPVKYLDLILGKRIITEVDDDFPLKWSDFFNE